MGAIARGQKAAGRKKGAAPAEPLAIDQDMVGWIERQVALLRAGRLDEIDAVHLAEELEYIGKTYQQQLTSALRILLMHMLKWDQQPEHKTRSWQFSIAEHRRRINRYLKRSPSLKSRLPEMLAEAYEDALPWAAYETHLPEDEFPKHCPYDWTDIMDRPFELDR